VELILVLGLVGFLPRGCLAEAADRWTWLLVVAHTQLSAIR
jgi:hypothetical protein